MHIITRLDMGGSAQNTLITCRELAGKYRTLLVHGLARESRMTAAEEAALVGARRDAVFHGVKFIPVSSLARAIHPGRDLRALLALLWHLWVERPDVVHTHTSKAGILGRLAARLAGVPHIVHTPHGHVFYGHFGRFSSRAFLALERYFGRFTERLVALTEGERADYVRLGVAKAADTLTVHSGVDVDAFAAGVPDAAGKRRSLGLDPQAPLVGFAGWLLPIKGPLHLINAMAAVWREHPETVLVLVGKGDQEVDLRNRAAQLGANGRVRFLGWREDVTEIMPLFDVFVLPSLNEGMGRVLVEAMAAGRPVVASRVGGIPDLVRHGESGLLVEAGDEHGLAAAITKLLSDPQEAKRLGECGRRRGRLFSIGAMVQRLDALYEDLSSAERRGVAAPPPGAGRRPAKGEAVRKGKDACTPSG